MFLFLYLFSIFQLCLSVCHSPNRHFNFNLTFIGFLFLPKTLQILQDFLLLYLSSFLINQFYTIFTNKGRKFINEKLCERERIILFPREEFIELLHPLTHTLFLSFLLRSAFTEFEKGRKNPSSFIFFVAP